MPNTARAIAALTYDDIEQHSGGTMCHDAQVPLLQRSIANDLRQLEATLGAKGKTNLFAIAAAIDEALLALVEE